VRRTESGLQAIWGFFYSLKRRWGFRPQWPCRRAFVVSWRSGGARGSPFGPDNLSIDRYGKGRFILTWAIYCTSEYQNRPP